MVSVLARLFMMTCLLMLTIMVGLAMISLLLPARPTRCGSPISPSIPPRKERLYFCAVKDISSKWIIGYAAAPDMGSALAVSALNTAVARRHINGYDVTGCIVHSDSKNRGAWSS